MEHRWPARIAGTAAGLANGLFGGGGGMVFLPILSRWGGLSQRKLYATCVGVIFPVCLVSAAVYLFRGGALPPGGAALSGGRPGGRLDRRQAVRQSLRQVAQMAVRRFSVLRGGEVSAVTDWIIPFLCGLGASILSAWGVGGGTLLLLVMTLFLDVDQRTAQGINLLFFLPTAASALVCHARGGYLDKPTLKSAVPLAVAAALAGAWIATNLDVAVLRKPFGVYLLLSGVSLLWPQRRKKQA